MSKNWKFGKEDVEELLFMLQVTLLYNCLLLTIK